MTTDKQIGTMVKKQGRLTIFASYFSGAGKSFAMMKAAEKAKADGVDVVIGVGPSEQWPETKKLADIFEKVPSKMVRQSGQKGYEIDLDACLRRQPQLIVIDELSHRNADDSRHRKRYQDIAELLKAGVDIYTTLDIQHVESIQDSVFSILRVPILERIPDHVFDRAAQVEFVDVEPERLQPVSYTHLGPPAAYDAQLCLRRQGCWPDEYDFVRHPGGVHLRSNGRAYSRISW